MAATSGRTFVLVELYLRSSYETDAEYDREREFTSPFPRLRSCWIRAILALSHVSLSDSPLISSTEDHAEADCRTQADLSIPTHVPGSPNPGAA